MYIYIYIYIYIFNCCQVQAVFEQVYEYMRMWVSRVHVRTSSRQMCVLAHAGLCWYVEVHTTNFSTEISYTTTFQGLSFWGSPYLGGNSTPLK